MLQVSATRLPALTGNALPEPAGDSAPSPGKDGEFDAVLSGLSGPAQPDEETPTGEGYEVTTPSPKLSLGSRMDPPPPLPPIEPKVPMPLDVGLADLEGQAEMLPAPSENTDAKPRPAGEDQKNGKRYEGLSSDSTPANPSQSLANLVEAAPIAPAAVASEPADARPVASEGSIAAQPFAARLNAGSLAGTTVGQAPTNAQVLAKQASSPSPIQPGTETISTADTQPMAPHRQARQTAVSSDVDPAFSGTTEVSTADDVATLAVGQGDDAASGVKGRPEAAMPQRAGHFILPTGLPPTPGALGPEIARIARGAPGDPVDIQLAPQELGRLRIRVWTENDTPRVSVQAERPETLDLLRRHGDVLVKELRAAGFEGGTLDFAGWSGGNARSTPLPVQPAMGRDGDFFVGPTGDLAAPEPMQLSTSLNLRL